MKSNKAIKCVPARCASTGPFTLRLNGRLWRRYVLMKFMKRWALLCGFTASVASMSVHSSCVYEIDEDVVSFTVSEKESAIRILTIDHPIDIDGWSLESIYFMYRNGSSVIDTLLASREYDGNWVASVGITLPELENTRVRVTYKNPSNECIKIATFHGK